MLKKILFCGFSQLLAGAIFRHKSAEVVHKLSIKKLLQHLKLPLKPQIVVYTSLFVRKFNENGSFSFGGSLIFETHWFPPAYSLLANLS